MSATAKPLPDVQIRPFQKADLKEVSMLLGMASMEQLAVANRLAYLHPVSLSVWAILSGIFIHFMNWYPQPQYGIIGYLRPFPGPAMVAVPLLFAVDWFQRQRIERNLRAKLSREDALNIIDFYSRSPASGFFVVAMNEIPIGCVAVDAACPDENLVDVISLKEKDPELKPKKNVQKRKYATADHALIRHFHVDGPYRVTGISSDLLSYGLRHVFTAGKEVQKIYAPWSKLSPGLNPVWKEAGFKAVSDGWASKQGVENDGASRFVSSGKWVEIERAAWEKKQS